MPAATTSSVPVGPPLAEGDPAFGQLTLFERDMLDRVRQGRPVFLLARTGSRVDVGLWFRQARLWLACLDDTLCLFAYGPRPLVEVHLYEALAGSLVNPITGDLVLAEKEATTPRRTIRLDLPRAHRVLAHIKAMKES